MRRRAPEADHGGAEGHSTSTVSAWGGLSGAPRRAIPDRGRDRRSAFSRPSPCSPLETGTRIAGSRRGERGRAARRALWIRKDAPPAGGLRSQRACRRGADRLRGPGPRIPGGRDGAAQERQRTAAGTPRGRCGTAEGCDQRRATRPETRREGAPAAGRPGVGRSESSNKPASKQRGRRIPAPLSQCQRDDF